MAGCLWLVDKSSFGSNFGIYKFDQSGNDQFSTFTTNYDDGGGVGVSKTDGSLWWVSPSSNEVIQYDQSGSKISDLSTPSSGPRDAALDFDDSIWITDGTANSVYKVTSGGASVTEFSFSGPWGVGVDPDGCIWVGTGASLYQHDTTGSLITSIGAGPADDVYGIGVEATGSIWLDDYYPANSVFEVNQSGTALTSFDSPELFFRGVGVEYEAQGSEYTQALTEVVQGRKN